MSDIKKLCQKKGITCEEHVDLSALTSFHIGGRARYVITIKAEEELLTALHLLQKYTIPWVVLGGGSNMLVPDEGFDGAVLRIQIQNIDIENETIQVGAGATTAQVAGKAVRAGLAGLGFAVGIPGKIGGAIVGNAGAMGGEMKDVITRVISYDADGNRIEQTNEQCQFGYRESIFKQKNEIIISAECTLVKGDIDKLKEEMKHNLTYRNTTQPKRYGSSGCMFKNYALQSENKEKLIELGVPQAMVQKGIISAGWLVDHAGCKGLQEGGAQVSTEHANFIVNIDNATAKDVKRLVEKVKEIIHTKFGIVLEDEVRYIG